MAFCAEITTGKKETAQMLKGGQGEGMREVGGSLNVMYLIGISWKMYLKRQHCASKLHSEAVGAKRRFEELRRQIWMSTKNLLAGRQRMRTKHSRWADGQVRVPVTTWLGCRAQRQRCQRRETRGATDGRKYTWTVEFICDWRESTKNKCEFAWCRNRDAVV